MDDCINANPLDDTMTHDAKSLLFLSPFFRNIFSPPSYYVHTLFQRRLCHYLQTLSISFIHTYAHSSCSSLSPAFFLLYSWPSQINWIKTFTLHVYSMDCLISKRKNATHWSLCHLIKWFLHRHIWSEPVFMLYLGNLAYIHIRVYISFLCSMWINRFSACEMVLCLLCVLLCVGFFYSSSI